MHPSGNIFDQVLLTGQSIKLQAKAGQITRVSFMDEDEDIVFRFKLDEFRRNSLINGLDDIGITMQHENDILDFERTRHKHGGVLTN